MRLLVPVLASFLLLNGCGSGNEPQGHGGGAPHGPPPPSQVGVATPIARDLPIVRELTGRIEAIATVELKPRVSGVVERVHVADGAEVKAGDPLLDIDEKPLKATVARAGAEVARSESLLAQAKVQFERSKRLVDGQVISRQQYDDQESTVHTSDAALAAAKAALESAQLDLGYAKVTAPIAGRIGKVITTQGNLVQGGGPVPATLIATLVSVDPVYVSFDLDEGTWRTVATSLRASASGGAAVPVTVGLVGENGYPHTGKVVFVDNRIDEGSGAIRIRAQVANPDRALTPGAFARVSLQTAPPRPVLLVHERAVQSQLLTRYVYTVDDQGITGIRPVRLGESVGQLRVVESGLGPNERIAVIGLAKIFYPGIPVTPVPASMETLEMAGAPADGAAPADKPAAEAKSDVDSKAESDAKPAPVAKPTEGKQP